MTMIEARRIAVLLGVVDGAKEFRESFEDSKKAFILVGDFNASDGPPHDDDSREGWEGEIWLPRDIAIETMRWIEARALAEIEGYGVTLPDTQKSASPAEAKGGAFDE